MRFFKTKEFWFILIIIAIGAFLRFYKLRELMVFLGDEGRDVLVVKRLIVDHDPILVGPTTSVGKIHLPPLYYYFMAPWLALFKLDPVGPAVGVAFLGTLTILLFYIFAKKLLGKNTAFFGTILYAVASVVVANSRFSWNPNLMPFIALLIVYNLYEVWQKKNFKAMIGVWIFLGLALQLHFMVILLVPFLTIFTLSAFWQANRTHTVTPYCSSGSRAQSREKSRTHSTGSTGSLQASSVHASRLVPHLAGLARRIKCATPVKKLILGNIIGFIIFLFLLSPLLIFDIRHNFINFYGLKEFFVKGHHTNANLFKIVKDLEGRSYQVIGDILGFSKNAIRNWFTRIVVIGFLVLAWIKRREKKELVFLAAWFMLGVLGLAVYEGDVYPHYLGFMFPLPFLIVGYKLSFLWKNWWWGKILSLVILIILSASNLSQSPAWENLGWNIEDIKQTAKVISENCEDKYNVALVDLTKDYRAMNYRYFLEILGCRPLDITEYPQTKTLYIISEEKLTDFDSLDLWEVKSMGELELIKNWKFAGGPYMYKLRKINN